MLKFIIVVVFLVWILWMFYVRFDEAFGPVRPSAAVSCADDVGFCADGSAVERDGPNCTFAACP
jgi:hypothetical protein